MAFDLVKFNQETHLVMTETIAQQVDKFNAQSNGTIQLIAKPFKGDFDVASSFKAIANLVRHRDVENGQNSISSARLTQHKNVAVKIAAGTPEIIWESAQYTWTMQNPQLAAIKIGEQLGRATVADMLNTAIKCGASAIKGNTALVEGDGTTALDFASLTKGASRFGDRSQAIGAWVMHSGALTNLQLKALGNNERLFTYENVSVLRDPQGRLFIVTDCPDLVDESTKHNILGLTEGGLIISNQGDFRSAITEKTGTENITNTYQAEWSYGASVKGYAWDMTAGGANPNAGALATPTNWKKIASGDKDTAGVLVVAKA